jgi:leucyl-tRNA synthetase
MQGWYPVPEEQLPVELPELEDYQPKGAGVSPLATVTEFVSVKCPGCGREAKRETDVSDTFLDSAWYFLRYPSVGAKTASTPFDQALTKKWLPVDMYIGGNEHAVLHLLYSRFLTMVLHDLGYLDFEEPYEKFRALGLIIHKGAKMSKSRGNVVNPNDYLDSYGADTLKMYLLFIGPFDQGGDFSDRAIAGMFRFLQRVWVLVQEIKNSPTKSASKEAERQTHNLIKKVTEEFEGLKFNTSIAHLMEFVNFAYKHKNEIDLANLKSFVLLISPFAPFLAEELWEELGAAGSIHLQAWPEFNPALTVEEKRTLIIQVNGKFRDKLEIEPDLSEEQVSRLVLDRDKVKSYTVGKNVKKTIYVKNKLFNLVVS